MTLETSTVNALLALIVMLQAWMIRELYNLKIRMAVMSDHCPHCRQQIAELTK